MFKTSLGLVLAMWSVLSSVPLSEVSDSISVLAENSSRPQAGGPGAVLSLAGVAPQRMLIGDFEAPDSVLVAYSPAWPDVTLALVESATRSARVRLLVERGVGNAELRRFRAALTPAAIKHLRVSRVEVATPWVRDYAPFQLKDREGLLTWVDAVYEDDDRVLDDQAPARLARELGVAIEPLDASLDGGAMASNGDGLCVATEEYFRAHGLDPDLDAEAVRTVQTQLGCRTLALIPAIKGEQTRHVDLIVQFVAQDRALILSISPSVNAEGARRTRRAEEVLLRAAETHGVVLELVRIPTTTDALGMYANYINGLRLADRMLVPSFGDIDPAVQAKAYARIQGAVPGLELVPIAVDEPWEGGGAVHCLAVGLVGY